MRHFKNTNFIWYISLCAGVLFLLSINSNLMAQTGAGGVGTNDGSSNLELWLDANKLGLSDGNPVSTWSDLSGNSNNATQGTASNQPIFNTNAINGLPALTFDGGNDFLEADNKINVTKATLFFVMNKTGAGGGFETFFMSDNHLILASSGEWGAWYGSTKSAGVAFNTTFRTLTHLQDGTSPNNVTGFFTTDGANRNDITGNASFHGANTSTVIGRNGTATDQFFEGNISEIVYYGRALNLAERIVVNSYLGNKYGLPTTGDEIKPFAFAANNGVDIAGIGQATDGSSHTASNSDFLEISNPTGLANDKFLLFGHDDADATAWTTTELAMSSNAEKRIAREWQLDETNGDVGDITFTINSVTSGLPAPDDGNTYLVVIDGDGDFATTGDQTTAEMKDPDANNTFIATNVQVNDGDFITIGQGPATNVAPIAEDSNAYTGVDSFGGSTGGAVIKISDFQFRDGNNGDQVESVIIETLPGSGTLFLDSNDNNSNDGVGEEITASDVISRSDIVANRLKWDSESTTTSGIDVDSFDFKVSDGDLTSTNTATMSISLGETSVEITGTEGWRFLTNPYSTAFNDLTSSIWTQGMIGSDEPTGSDNIITYDETTETFAAPSDISQSLGAGTGTAVFVFEDDDGVTSGVQGSFPKTLSTDITGIGDITTGAVSVDITNTDGDNSGSLTNNEGWNLIANPYGTAIEVDSLIASLDESVNALNQNVSIWDNATSSYTDLSGDPNDMNSFTIAPFQSFFVRAMTPNDNVTATLNDNIRTNSATFIGKSVERPLISLNMDNGDVSSSFALNFRNEAKAGLDIYDAFQLGSLASDYADLYSIIGDQRIARSVLPADISEAFEVPLYTNTTMGGTFTIESSLVNLPSGWSVEIENVRTGNVTKLTDGTTFSLELPEVDVQGKSRSADEGSILPTVSSAASGDEAPQLILSVKPGVFTSVEDPLDNKPKEFELSQNFPNPFNPSTQIQFQLPQRADVNLKVYDLMGREVATLVNEARAAGQHTVTFDASRLSSGVYLYRLDTGGQIFTKKMILIK
mgnify:CR=1 FL=1